MPTDDERAVASKPESAAMEPDDELPVVARMVVEIRSDGTRTIARGALDDRVADQQVAIKIESASPLSLVRQLAGAILKAPSLGARAWRARRRRKALKGG